MNSDRLVLVDTYASPVDAEIAKGVLDTNGIPAVVNGSNTTTIYGGLLPALDARLYVRECDYRRAVEILRPDTANGDVDADIEPTPRQQRVLKIAQIVIGVILFLCLVMSLAKAALLS